MHPTRAFFVGPVATKLKKMEGYKDTQKLRSFFLKKKLCGPFEEKKVRGSLYRFCIWLKIPICIPIILEFFVTFFLKYYF